MAFPGQHALTCGVQGVPFLVHVPVFALCLCSLLCRRSLALQQGDLSLAVFGAHGVLHEHLCHGVGLFFTGLCDTASGCGLTTETVGGLLPQRVFRLLEPDELARTLKFLERDLLQFDLQVQLPDLQCVVRIVRVQLLLFEVQNLNLELGLHAVDFDLDLGDLDLLRHGLALIVHGEGVVSTKLGDVCAGLRDL